MTFLQEPVAVVGMACRLPGGISSPNELWEFIINGEIASTDVPETRFNLKAFFAGSPKGGSMRSPGGMFLRQVDPRVVDANFFGISHNEAVAMDPQQRQILEVAYECLENAGIPKESVDGSRTGCFVASYAIDYADIQARDPDDRAPSVTVGIGRAILANRISHFLNLKGPSITIDTACSGSLVAVDMACRYLHTGEIDGALVGGVNLYLNPDHNLDQGSMREAATASGRCHVFDAKADGYIKAEGVNSVYLKRLSDAIRDGDPIRAVIRGSASSSNGRTMGIVRPDSAAQAETIRRAYANAGIDDFSKTGYLECHGTGTQAGDKIEAAGVGSVFASCRPADSPLVVGSIKSNIGHSEPAAGLSGLMKVVLAMEHGMVPGTPTFITPNPDIDLAALKLSVPRYSIAWPQSGRKRASVNSFGFGGANAHSVLEEYPGSRHVSSYCQSADNFFDDAIEDNKKPRNSSGQARPHLLVFSANDHVSLTGTYAKLIKHFARPDVQVSLGDLAFTLSEHRSRLFKRGYAVASSARGLREADLVMGEKGVNAIEAQPSIGFVFTGQGAQWPEMGKDLLARFPAVRPLLEHLNGILQGLPSKHAPRWNLVDELTQPRSAEAYRDPEFAQPLTTALQIAILSVLDTWDIKPRAVVGHSSGEIAAAFAAGYLTAEEALLVAFFRGKSTLSALNNDREYGMLSVGLDAASTLKYLYDAKGDSNHLLSVSNSVQIACFNAPKSVTLSGHKAALEIVQERLQSAGHFARMLQVTMAYHSNYMAELSDVYVDLLQPYLGHADAGSRRQHLKNGPDASRLPKMFSSVRAAVLPDDTGLDPAYWRDNMVSPVRFEQAVAAMFNDEDAKVQFVIEIGPAASFRGPVGQIKATLPRDIANAIVYRPSLERGEGAADALFHLGGQLFLAGVPVDVTKVNSSETPGPAAAPGTGTAPSVVVDLPNYAWNHSTQYWYENDSSKDWRLRPFLRHDLLGNKVLGSPWDNPTFKCYLRLGDSPWLRDHKLGDDVIFPAAGYIAMAIEALRQKTVVTAAGKAHGNASAADSGSRTVRLRDVEFNKTLLLEENRDHKLLLTLTCQAGGKLGGWHHFNVSSFLGDDANSTIDHCQGLVRLDKIDLGDADVRSLEAPPACPVPASRWYKAMLDVGYNWGPAFQNLLDVDCVPSSSTSKCTLSLEPPHSQDTPVNIQSWYPMHPANMDSCFQSCSPSLWQGKRHEMDSLLVPAVIEDLAVTVPAHWLGHVDGGSGNNTPAAPTKAMATSSSVYRGPRRGRLEDRKNLASQTTVYDTQTGKVLMRLTGLRYHRMDSANSRYSNHKYSRLAWQPDISLFSMPDPTSTKHGLLPDSPKAASVPGLVGMFNTAGRLLDVVAHKKPTLRVLEVNFVTDNMTMSVWLAPSEGDGAECHLRSACPKFRFSCPDSSALLKAQELYQSQSGAADDSGVLPGTVEFSLAGLGPVIPLDTGKGEPGFDVMVLACNNHREARDVVSESLKGHSSIPYLMLLIHNMTDQSGPNGVNVEDENIEHLQHLGYSLLAREGACSDGLYPILVYRREGSSPPVDSSSTEAKRPAIMLINLDEGANSIHTSTAELLHYLKSCGYDQQSIVPIADAEVAIETVHEAETPGERGGPQKVLLITEFAGPLLPSLSAKQWHALQLVINSGLPVLWVTEGSQLASGTTTMNPTKAMIHGMKRVVRSEDSLINLTTLDLADPTSPGSRSAVETLLRELASGGGQKLGGGGVDSEFCERNGVIYVPRLVPDIETDSMAQKTIGERALETRAMHASPSTVRLQCEKVGSIDSLVYSEVVAANNTLELPLATNTVEVEVFASGVNFKDVAVTMGIVPDNEHLLGLEGAGVIRRLSPDVQKYRIGQRVLVFEKGTFANRIIATTERVYPLPDTMTFEEASTLPSVYLTALYSLFELGQIHRGSRVLIHSASGGLGVACIEICRHIGAEVFATVGTEAKKEFLVKTHGIDASHIFDSRSSTFADKVMHATGGYGVDVIVNSLVGELLEESWRCVAEGGVMVELGKRDHLDRHQLPMQPFGRNASYRCFDMSHRQVSDALIARLLDQMFGLLAQGHIHPISPVKIFPFVDIDSAMRYMRSGTQHIGKIVLSNQDRPPALSGTTANAVLSGSDEIAAISKEHEWEAPVRPAPRKLRLSQAASYLVVGGLRGLCGAVCLQLAMAGARSLVVLSRSGVDDAVSRTVIRDIEAQGCQVTGVRGDVTLMEDVKRFVASAPYPIRGVVQGAMVLRDRSFSNMGVDDYHSAVRCKVDGTWNLHRALTEGQGHALDFFTLMSSVSGVVGQKGQANYAAANTFLDAFAAYRRDVLGLPACSVALGAIEDLGYMSEHDDLFGGLDKTAWTPINERLFWQIMEDAILQDMLMTDRTSRPNGAWRGRSQLITSVMVPQPADSNLLADARLSGLLKAGASSASSAPGGGSSGQSSKAQELHLLLQQLRNHHSSSSGSSSDSSSSGESANGDAEFEERLRPAISDATRALLAEQFAKIMRVTDNTVDMAKPPVSYGMDSLASVELRNWVRQALNVKLTALEISGASSLSALGDKITSAQMAVVQST